jgi:MarR family transcriptional regulator, lower aerobic nicotinate degradation pathway regulator
VARSAPRDVDGGNGAALGGYAVEEQVGFLLRRANQRHTALFLEGMAALELTPTQFTALIKTVEQGRVTQNQLGRLAAMDPATIQGVVRRLTRRGLLERRADPMDRRASVLAATPAGLALARRAVPLARAITAATLDAVDPADRPHLLALLRRLG